MRWNYGKLRQKFEISIDIDELVLSIANKVVDEIASLKEIDSAELDECFTEDNTIVIDACYDAPFRSYYAPATYFDPADYDEERPFISDGNNDWLLDGLSQEIKDLVKIAVVIETDDDCERKYNGGEE